MSTSTRTWWQGSETHRSSSGSGGRRVAKSTAADGCSSSRWPFIPGAGATSRSGIAPSGLRRRTECYRTRSGAGSPPGSWTGRVRAYRDESGVRWVAVRHALDHIHLVATLARQDGGRVKPGMTSSGCGKPAGTPKAAGLAGHGAGGLHRRQAAHPRRNGAGAPARMARSAPRVSAPGSVRGGGRGEFGTGVLRPARTSRGPRPQAAQHDQPGRGHRVRGRPGRHTTKDGGIIWYGGGKLAADLSLPKLRARWAGPAEERLGQPVHGVMARAVLGGTGHRRGGAGPGRGRILCRAA